MLDWISAKIQIVHKPIKTGHMLMIDEHGEVDWENAIKQTVEGSYSAKFQVKSIGSDGDGMATHLYISGNPSKWLQGHNVTGSDSLLSLVYDTCIDLFESLSLKPSEYELIKLFRGHYEISRIDINYMFSLPCQSDVDRWLKAAEFNSKTRHGRPSMKGGTVYWGKSSRRWSIKAYSKYTELQVKNRGLPEHLVTSGLEEWSKDKLRIEVVLRQLELKKYGMASGVAVDRIGLNQLFNRYVKRLEMSESMSLTDETLEALPNCLKSTYRLWVYGEDIANILPKATFYRHRKMLIQEADIDINVMRYNNRQAHNVIPLVRVLEAGQVSIPVDFYTKGYIYSS
jgi:II/X family phage/plasmid replication protein